MDNVVGNADTRQEIPVQYGMTAVEKQRALMWCLLIGGVLLVLFSNTIGHGLVPKVNYAPGSFGWSPDEEKAIALQVKTLGFMLFAAGLVERIVVALHRPSLPEG